MRTVFRKLQLCLLAGWVSGSGLTAEVTPPELGFVRIVHAIAPGVGNASFMIDGGDVFPKGYRLGQATGGIGLKAGVHTIGIQKKGVVKGSTKVDLKHRETMTFIGFAEKTPAVKAGGPPVWKAGILRLKQSAPERGYRMTVVSVCERDEVVVKAVVRGRRMIETLRAKRLRAASLDMGKSRGEVLVTVGGELVTTVSPEDPGNYVVVLFDDGRGGIKALSFYDPRFVVAG